MQLARTWDEIARNIRLVVEGLQSANESDRRYSERLVLRGTCFVAATQGGKVVFAPSRFIGYAGNSKADHEANVDKDGRDTNPVIAQILLNDWTQDDELEQRYQLFCKSLGPLPITPAPSERRGSLSTQGLEPCNRPDSQTVMAAGIEAMSSSMRLVSCRHSVRPDVWLHLRGDVEWCQNMLPESRTTLKNLAEMRVYSGPSHRCLRFSHIQCQLGAREPTSLSQLQ